MPQYPQPPEYPDWTSGQPTQVSAPTPSLQASGFTSGQRPAFQTLNWLYWKIGAWIRYFSQGLNAVMVGASQEPGYRLIGGGTWSWNASSGVLAWSDPFAISMPGLADSANTAAAGSVTLTAGQVAYVASNAPFTTTGNLTSGSAQVTNLAYESGIAVGETVTGTGVPAGTTVLSISQSDATLTLSAAATATAANVSLTFATSGALTVQAAAVQGMATAANTVVIARCYASTGPNQVHVGVNSGQMLLRDGEAKPLLSNGYVITQRVKAAVTITPNSFVYLAPISDGVTYIRSGSSTNNLFLYTDAVNGYTLPANQIAVGDTVNSGGVTATVTGVAANGNITVSPSLTTQNEGFSPYPITPISLVRQVGLAYLTDASPGVPLFRAQPLGIVPTTTAAGATAHVVQAGTVNGFSSLSVGAPYYLSTLNTRAGQCSPTIPNNPGQTQSLIGTALSSTSLLLNSAAATQAFVQNNGYKSVIDMGFYWQTNSTANGLQSTLDTICMGTTANVVVRKYIFTHPGSVTGLSVHLNNTVAPATTVYVGKAANVLCQLTIPGGTLDGQVTFPKGSNPFVAGEPLFGYVYFQGQTGINCALRLYATVEFTP